MMTQNLSLIYDTFSDNYLDNFSDNYLLETNKSYSILFVQFSL